MYQFIHLATGGHLECLQVWAIRNSFCKHLCAGFCVDVIFSFSGGPRGAQGLACMVSAPAAPHPCPPQVASVLSMLQILAFPVGV